MRNADLLQRAADLLEQLTPVRHDQDALVVARHTRCDVAEDNRLARTRRGNEQGFLMPAAKAVAHSLNG